MNTRFFQNSIVRLAGFLLLLLLILHVCNTFLVKIDLFAYLTLDELEHTENIEFAVVGSSLVQNHFDPEIIENATGLRTFDVCVPYMSFPGAYALTDQLFESHSPDCVALVFDPVTASESGENIESQFRLTRHLKGFTRRIRYYLEACKADGRYLERLFLFRTFPINSMEDVERALRMSQDAPAYYVEKNAVWNLRDVYEGRGHVRFNKRDGLDTILKSPDFMRPLAESMALSAETRDALLRYRDLCEKNGAELLIVIHPYMGKYLAANPVCQTYCADLADFCAQNRLTMYDLNLARSELLGDLEPYYADSFHHITPEGAQLLSEAFARLYTLHAAGEDASSLFFPSYAERLGLDR